MAIDNKYGRVRFDEENTIGEDEPVVVFRAADPTLPTVLLGAVNAAVEAGSPKKHIDALAWNHQVISRWQAEHPDLVRERPSSSNWDGENRIV